MVVHGRVLVWLSILLTLRFDLNATMASFSRVDIGIRSCALPKERRTFFPKTTVSWFSEIVTINILCVFLPVGTFNTLKRFARANSNTKYPLQLKFSKMCPLLLNYFSRELFFWSDKNLSTLPLKLKKILFFDLMSNFSLFPR